MSALLLSFAMAGLVVIIFLIIGPSSATAWLVPPLLCAIAAFVFTVIWPSESWRWGLVLSSGFWAFFVVVFVAYLSVSKLDGITLLRALSVLLAGVAASVVASVLRSRGDALRLRG
jgi:hypothetical protein